MHSIRSSIVAAMLLVAIAVGMSIRNAVVEKQNATRAEGLVEALVNADITHVPSIVYDLKEYRTWADPLLKAKFPALTVSPPCRPLGKITRGSGCGPSPSASRPARTPSPITSSARPGSGWA